MKCIACPMKGRKSSSRYWIKANIARSAPAARRGNLAVRLICATTEPVSSSLLRTFQRRIQVAIDLPGIRQRSVEEQIELIIGFLQRESRKIERTVSIDKTLLLWLLNKPLEGNIGQLKSDIQFLCAQAWASGMAAHNEVLLLDSKLADGPINATPEQRQLVDALFNGRPLLNIDARTLPQLKSSAADDSVEESDLFYSFLTREYVNLRNSNVPPAETLAILKNKLSSIFEYGLYSRDNASHAPRYGDRIEERVGLLIGYVEQVLGFALPENLVNPLRKHFLALISYVQRGLIPQLYSSSLILDRCKDEYDNATLLCKKINDLLHIQCPATEVVWLCLFLKECRHYRQRINASPDCGGDPHCPWRHYGHQHGAVRQSGAGARIVQRYRHAVRTIGARYAGKADPVDPQQRLAAADPDGRHRIAGSFR